MEPQRVGTSINHLPSLMGITKPIKLEGNSLENGRINSIEYSGRCLSPTKNGHFSSKIKTKQEYDILDNEGSEVNGSALYYIFHGCKFNNPLPTM